MPAQLPTFGLLLKRHRLAGGMTQEELADRANVSVRAIGDLERGLRQPRNDTLQLLLATLQLTTDEEARLEVAARSDWPGNRPGTELEAFGTGAPPLLLPTGSFLGALPPGPIIGRQQEIDRIVAAVDAVIGGGSRLVLLTGEPGIGKTRLGQQIALEATKRGFLVVSGRSYESEQDVPFYPFLEALTAANQQLPRAIHQDLPRRWPSLCTLLSDDVLQRPQPAYGAWSAALDEQHRLFRAIGGFLKAVSEERPIALLLDDLHWADDASIKLLLHLVRHLTSERLLLLGIYRDVDTGPHHSLTQALVDLNRERLAECVVLRRLDRERTAELIAATEQCTQLCPELQMLIRETTDGNPFFIQEVLRDLDERGELVRHDGCLMIRDHRELHVPDTVQSLIQQRALRLDATAQRSLDEASVLGQTFSFKELQSVGKYEAEELDASLQAAVATGLLREADAGHYAFNHALTHQAFYAALSTQRRQRLHLAVAEVLHQLPHHMRVRRSAELARHFRAGGDRERAAMYNVLAGDQAVGLHAYAEAERHFRSAVELLKSDAWVSADLSPLSDALVKLGCVLHSTERYEEALTILEDAAELYRRQGCLVGEGRAVAEIGWIHSYRGSDEEGLRRVQPIRAALDRENASPEKRRTLAALYATQARLFFGLGRYSDELAAAERSVQLARDTGDGAMLAKATTRQGAALMMVGRREEARAALEAAVALAETADDPMTATGALDYLGEIARDSGDYRQSQRDFERAVKLAEAFGVARRIGWTLIKLGRIHLLKGEWSRARAILQQALQLLGDDPRLAAYARIHLGQLDLMEGNRETGGAQVEDAMQAEAPDRDLWLRRFGQRLLAEQDVLDGQPAAAIARLTPLVAETRDDQKGTMMFSLLHVTLARAYVELDQEEEAEGILAVGLAWADAHNHCVARLDLLGVQGVLQTGQERWREASRSLEAVIDLTQRMPDPFREALARIEAGRLAIRTGKTTEARQQLREALAIMERLGAHPSIRRIRQLFGELGRVEDTRRLTPIVGHQRKTLRIEPSPDPA